MYEKIIDLIFNRKAKANSSDFAQFFLGSKSSYKKKIIKEVVRKANLDQKKLVKDRESSL